MDCLAFIEGLLNKNPKERLGHKSENEIFDHPWFLGMNFTALLNKEVPSMIVPSISSDTSLENFDMFVTNRSKLGQ